MLWNTIVLPILNKVGITIGPALIGTIQDFLYVNQPPLAYERQQRIVFGAPPVDCEKKEV